MTSSIDLIYQLLPILIGLALLFAIKSISLVRSKIQIATPEMEELISECRPRNNEVKSPSQEQTIKDLLITNGKLSPINTDLQKFALNNSGIVTYGSIPMVPEALTFKPKKLIMLINEKRLFDREKMRKCRSSGFILAYHIDGNIEMVTS